MAEGKASLIMELKDKVTEGLSSINKTIKSLKSNWFGITAAVVGVGGAIYAAIKAFGEQEAAVVKLDLALKNAGLSSTGATQRLTALASELQKTTTYSDESIISMQALLATFKLNESTIALLTPKLLDVSTAMGIDLQTAALSVGKALSTGSITMLTRMGIVADEAAFKIDPLSALMQAFASSNGQAAAAAKTTLGQLAQLKIQFGELMEVVGGYIVGPAMKFVQWAKDTVIWLQNAETKVASFILYIGYMGETWINNFLLMQETLTVFWTFLQEFALTFELLLTGNFPAAFQQMGTAFSNAVIGMQNNFAKLDTRNKQSLATFQASNKALTQDDLITKATLLAQGEKHTATEDKTKAENDKKRAEQEKKMLEDSRKRNEEHFLNMQKLRQQEEKEQSEKIKREQEQNKIAHAQKISDLNATFSTIASMTQSSNKTLFGIGKAAAMATAIMNIAKGVTQALGAAPPPYSFALAALVAAAGAVQLHTIGAQSMAEGGIVLPRTGGTLARIGEAGQSEAIIPLDDERAGGIMGGATININAGVVVADDESIRKLAEMIDAKLFDLSRNNMSVIV